MRMKMVAALFLVSLLLAGCWEGEIGMGAPESFPQRDIVFQRDIPLGGGQGFSLGFVNADGSGLIVMEFHALFIGWSVMANPVWSSDGSTIVFRALGHGGGGTLMIIRADKGVQHCPDGSWGWGQASFLEGNKEAVVEGWTGTDDVVRPMVIDLETCKVLQVYLSEAEEEVVGNPAMTPDGQWLAFVRWENGDFRYRPSDLVVLEVASGAQTVIGKGRWPSWSPDGRWLAYAERVYDTREMDYITKGIYVVARDGSQGRKVAFCYFPDCDDWYPWPPAPSWSPDGRWLVYHRCMVDPCNHGTDAVHYSIFKVNVETGEEVKIVDGGLNPYWRWGEP